MKLKMVRGRETSLIVEDVVKSITEDGFLSDSYTKALHALFDYIERTDPIREQISRQNHSSARNRTLYQAPQNIIAFSGKRGCGKSSTMISFSRLLDDREELGKLCSILKRKKEYLKVESRRFVVIDPIDPTTLEHNQSILSVILSRLLFEAESKWLQNSSFYGGFQDKESQKTELLTLARQCLNGIRAVKENEKIAQDLSDLQRVGDSSILKKNLYDFVELFFQFYSTDRTDSALGSMLILQIDDTDCQITQGHTIMEDIRKYLTIPNVLILMATDTKLLRQVLSQHYVSDFHHNLQLKLIKMEEIWNLGEKYLAKLIPPSYVIYLPNIDEIIREKTDQIYFYYYNSETDDELREKNLLDPCGAEKYENYDFQTVILRYIYRKTHIVFTVHDAYLNNIIPTTLRGLAYLLGQFSSMEDIPEIDFSHEPFDIQYLAEALEAQFTVWERNLNLFEEYFLHDWIHTKLPQEMVEIMERISVQALDQRIPFIMRELAAYYGKQLAATSITEFPYAVNNDYSQVTYADLDEQIRTIQGTHKRFSGIQQFRQAEDYYFIFAIRTLLTIKNNKEILRLKRRTVKNFRPDEEKYLVFDYLNGKTSLPTGFYIDAISLYGYQLVADEGIKYNKYVDALNFQATTDQKAFENLYFDSPYHGSERRFNFTGGVVKWLSPKEDDYKDMNQREIFMAQEAAALMAANCDVQEVARKAIVSSAETEVASPSVEKFSEAVEQGLWLIQNAIAHINQGMLVAYKREDDEKTVWMLSSEWKKNLNAFYAASQKEDKKEAQKVLRKKFEDVLPLQYNEDRIRDFYSALYNYTKELKNVLPKNRKKVTKNTSALIHKLENFQFTKNEDDVVANSNEFNELLNQLYTALDALLAQEFA